MIKSVEVCKHVSIKGRCDVCFIKCPYHIGYWFGYWADAPRECLAYECNQ